MLLTETSRERNVYLLARTLVFVYVSLETKLGDFYNHKQVILSDTDRYKEYCVYAHGSQVDM